VETQKPACTKVVIRENEYDAPMAALTVLISGSNTFSEHRPNAMSIQYVRYMCSNNQSVMSHIQVRRVVIFIIFFFNRTCFV
jgi:hypothetical protein